MESTFNRVQMLNFLALSLLRDEAERDPISACAKFGLTRKELEDLTPHLSPERVLATVANLSVELLFKVRPNLGKVLAGPPPLMGALLAVNGEPLARRAA